MIGTSNKELKSEIYTELLKTSLELLKEGEEINSQLLTSIANILKLDESKVNTSSDSGNEIHKMIIKSISEEQ